MLDNGKLTLYYDKEKKNRQGTILLKSEWADHADEITECVIDPSFANCKPINLNFFFEGLNNMKSIKGLDNFNTSNVTGMCMLFHDCSSLMSLDLSSFNTSNVTDMSGVFENCSSLTSLDVSSFNTSNVTHMNSMFGNCSALTNLDVSGFNTSNVVSMTYMFDGCSSLTSLDVSSFNTSNVTYMSGMFANCSSLTSLDVSGFNTSNVTKMDRMFYNCSSLTTIYADEKEWNTSNITNGDNMFAYCSKLVGGNGTAYSDGNWGLEYARIDKEGSPGYLTIKTETGIQLPKAMGMEVGVWYTLDGRRLDAQPTAKGLYINQGKKILVK